jgi:hypothetical protein
MELRYFSVRFHSSCAVSRSYTATYELVSLLRKVCGARQEVLRLEAEDLAHQVGQLISLTDDGAIGIIRVHPRDSI